MITTLDLFMSGLFGFCVGVGVMMWLRDMERDALENMKLSEIRSIADSVRELDRK